MPTEATIDPPISVTERNGRTFTLTSIGELIEYIRRRDTGENNWRDVRRWAFVAAAVPSAENIEALRQAADRAFCANQSGAATYNWDGTEGQGASR